MRKITILFMLFIGLIGIAQNGPINFETSGFGANWNWTVFENGTNPAVEIITNPDPSGINTSANVMKFTALQAGQPWAGCESQHGADLGAFTWNDDNRIIKIMVWKSVISDVGIKFASNSNWAQVELKVPNTVINQWEELTFDFSDYINPPDGEGTLDQIIIFPDFNLSGRTQDNIVYIDNITFSDQNNQDTVDLPLDFEMAAETYTFTEFGGAVTTVIANPDASGLNTSAQVAQMTKTAGAEPWAGSFIELASPIDFSTNQAIKIKTWAPQAGIVVRMKLENLANPDINVEVDVTNTVANTWEELTFNFPGIINSNNYQRLVVFFNFDVSGTGEHYYFDDVMLTSSDVVSSGITLPIDFEDEDLVYAFENFGGAVTEKIANPDASGENTSAQVAAFNKTEGAETWAGSFIELSTPIDFSNGQAISMKSWAPAAGLTVLMKLENLSNPDINIEISTTTTVANTWETITFEFPGIINANNYQRIVVFYNFGTAGTGETYYFDDITLEETDVEVLELPLDFESDTLTYNFSNFGGAETSKIQNPDASGINTSAHVAQLQKNTGAEPWAGSFIELGTPIDFSDSEIIKIKTWAPQAGIIVKMKLENLSNPDINVELDVTNTVANAWEELSFEFEGINNADQYQRIVIFFNFDVAGNGEFYYFDDVAVFQALSIDNFIADKAILFPNPSREYITIKSPTLISSYSIINTNGQVVMRGNENQLESTINVSQLPSGIYFVNILGAEASQTLRFIKN